MSAGPSSSPIIPSKEKQTGEFSVTFDAKDAKQYFIEHFSDTATYFSSSGVISLSPLHDDSPLVRGEYTAIGGVDVLKALQFSVNKTFNKDLSVFDPHAFSSGSSKGAVSITSLLVGDVPKRAEVASAVSKTIIVSASGLDRDLNILFAFSDPNNDQLYHTQFPTAWKVAYLSKGLNNTFSATYTTQYAVGAVQLVNGNLITPSVWTDSAPGDSWNLTYKNNTYRLELTKPGDPTNTNAPITVLNSTGGPNPIAVGFDSSGNWNIALTQSLVGNGQTSRFLFTPVINAWVVSDYVQNQVLSSEILSPPLFGKGLNLLSLTPVTSFKFTQNPDGSYSIAQI